MAPAAKTTKANPNIVFTVFIVLSSVLDGRRNIGAESWATTALRPYDRAFRVSLLHILLKVRAFRYAQLRRGDGGRIFAIACLVQFIEVGQSKATRFGLPRELSGL
jgi:hypothetical protein